MSLGHLPLRRVLIALVLVAVLMTLTVGSVVRIPAGRIGVGEGGWLRPGWHLRVPLRAFASVPNPGDVVIDSIEALTAKGQARRVTVSVSYRIGPAADAALARSIAAEDLGAALKPHLVDVLARALHSDPRARLPRLGSPSDSLGSAFAARLHELGIEAEELTWRRTDASQGPPVAPLLASRRNKLLIVGLDAADWQIAEPMMRAGNLPNLARIVREGARASLRSYDPMISPLIWTTMVTGVGPDAHGIADFLVDDTTSGRRVPISSRFRKVKALWNIFSDAGLTSGFIGWWASHPAEPVRGYLVSELLGFSMMRPHDGAEGAGAGTTYPDSYYPMLLPRLIRPADVGYEDVARILKVGRGDFEAAVDASPPLSPQPDAKPFAQDPVWLVRKVLAATHNYETVAVDLLGRDLDVVGVYFEGIDMMGHRFQHCMSPRMPLCSEEEYARERDAVEAFYVVQDEVLGRILQAAPGRTILVVSDHGFRNGADRPPDYLPYTTSQPVEWHREYGIFVLSGPGTRRGAVLDSASVYDIAPTVLYVAGLPKAEDMRGRILTEAIAPAELRQHPPRSIASYEDMGAPLSAIAAASDTASPEAQEEMIRNLQALGYVGGAVAAGPRGAEGGERTSVEGAALPRPANEERTESRVTYHRNLATYYMKEGRLTEAESELSEANRIQPLPKSYELLSEIRASRGDIEGAVDSLEEALGRFPNMDPEAVLWMVDLRLRQGQPDAAADILGSWREKLSRPAILAACEGKIAAARGEEDRAIASLLEALRREPDLSQAALSAAPLLAKRGRLAELEGPVVKALSRERRLDEYQNLLGLIRLQAGRNLEAFEAFGRALDVSPTDARFLENLAASALAAGRSQAAVERYRAALKDPRAGGAVWSGYGRLLGNLRRPAEAAGAFEKALTMGEKSAATYAGYAASLIQTGRRARSREILGEALRAYPDDPALAALMRAAAA